MRARTTQWGGPPLTRVVVLALALMLAAVAAEAQSPAARPNVLVVLVDDMGIGDLRSYNPDSKISTPNLDRLAARGMRFTDAHAPGAWCIPSRYGLLTGRDPARLASLDVGQQSLIEPGRTTLASLLRDSGYTTAMVGKWHLGFDGGMDCTKRLRGGPVDRGFDRFFGIHASTDIPPYFYVRGDECVAAPTVAIDSSASGGHWNHIQGAFWRAGAIAPGLHLEDVLPRFREEAVAFLEQHHRDRRADPFFLYVALPAPHTPWLPLPAFQGVSGAGMYGDFVTQVDDLFGQLATTLDSLGFAQNTLVVFTSDNGPVWYDKDVQRFGHRSSHIYRGMKFDAWEGGHRMPFLVRWPGRVAAGSVSDATASFTDLLATFASVVGTPLPAGAGEDSRDMLPTLLGQAGGRPIRESLVHYARPGLAIRQGPWKLIAGREDAELYNLADDPSETRNQYRTQPAVARRLEALLAEYRRETGARADRGSEQDPAVPVPAATRP